MPEVSLHLVTSRCPWWRCTPEALAAAGVAEPFWAFAWAGGQALARYLLDHPEVARARRVLDFGAGGGLAGLAA
ncbi:MAG: methyltransferase, partial [Pseudomonadota bacterium]